MITVKRYGDHEPRHWQTIKKLQAAKQGADESGVSSRRGESKNADARIPVPQKPSKF
jgi:hypothetical protein